MRFSTSAPILARVAFAASQAHIKLGIIPTAVSRSPIPVIRCPARVRDFTVKRPNHFTFYTRCKLGVNCTVKCKFYTLASGQIFVTAPSPGNVI